MSEPTNAELAVWAKMVGECAAIIQRDPDTPWNQKAKIVADRLSTSIPREVADGLAKFIRDHTYVTHGGHGCSAYPHCIACKETTWSYGGNGHTDDCDLQAALAAYEATKEPKP